MGKIIKAENTNKKKTESKKQQVKKASDDAMEKLV